MHCPNCGAQNKKKQNYCRYCGLHLPDIEKLFLSQLVFGEDTKQMKRLRDTRNAIYYIQIFLVVLFVFGIFRLISGDNDWGRFFVKISVGSFVLSVAADKIIGYFHRQALKTNKRNVVANAEPKEMFETRETARLIEERGFSPIANMTEKSTELLFVDKK